MSGRKECGLNFYSQHTTQYSQLVNGEFKLKVLHVISSAGFYGAESVVLDLLKGSKKNGVKPYLVCLKNRGKRDPVLYTRAVEQGVRGEVITCRSKFDLKAVSYIREAIARERTDIVHTHNYKSDLYGFIAARISRVPVMATVHGWTGEDNKVKFYEFLDKWVIKHMDLLTAVSFPIFSELLDRGVKGEKVLLMPNAVDTMSFDPISGDKGLRKKLGLERALVVGTVGRLSPEKNQIGLLKAFKEISSNETNARLLLVGDGKLKDELKNRAGALGLEDKTVFAGEQEDMTSVYKCMDMFILPSLTEGTPIALLEAMSMALPVVAANVGGVSRVLKEDTGVLVAPGDIKELSGSILELVRDSFLRQRLGERARQSIRERFSLEKNSEKYREIYEGLLGS